jgi:chromosome segregation ATPase
LASDHLKSAICALNEKLKFYENIEQERDNAREEVEQTDLARKELRSNILETAERINEEKEKNIKYQNILINENQSLSKQILVITDMFSKKVSEYDSLNFNLSEKEKEFSGLKLEKDSLSDY